MSILNHGREAGCAASWARSAESVSAPSLSLAPLPRYRHQRKLLGSIGPGEIDAPTPRKLKVNLACKGEQGGGGRSAERTQERSVPVASLSLGSVLTGLYSALQIQFSNAWDMDGQHEAHFVRREAEG
jgi:hypothetical protein